MITAVDSSVLLDVFAGDPVHHVRSLQALEACSATGRLVSCDVVWAEVGAYFGDSARMKAVMASIPVAFEPLSMDAALRAGEAWGAYRRAGGSRARLIADYLVGAHAILHADRLLTRDRGFTRRAFAGLTILDPAHS